MFMTYIVLYRYIARTGSRLIMKFDLFPISIMENVSPLMQKMMLTKSTKDKQRSTKHTYKTKDRVTRIPLKTGGELRCSGSYHQNN
jgi:regulator of PEP synthase PpsR (kinase-PPPase family)